MSNPLPASDTLHCTFVLQLPWSPLRTPSLVPGSGSCGFDFTCLLHTVCQSLQGTNVLLRPSYVLGLVWDLHGLLFFVTYGVLKMGVTVAFSLLLIFCFSWRNVGANGFGRVDI